MITLLGRDPDPNFLVHTPFSRLSAHHRQVGRGAAGADAVDHPELYYGIPGTTGPATRGRLGVVTQVTLPGPTSLRFNRRVLPTDPQRTITRNPGTTSASIPEAGLITRVPGAGPFPPETASIADTNLYLYPENGAFFDVGNLLYQARLLTENRASICRRYGLSKLDTGDGSDGMGTGSGVSKIRIPSSIARYNEWVNLAPIRHCLSCAATRKGAPPELQVLNASNIWPAYGKDVALAGESQGDLPLGTRCVIRWQDRGLIDSLGLTPRGKLLFTCLLHYGFYIMSGNSEYDAVNNGASLQFAIDNAPTSNGQWPTDARAEFVDQMLRLIPHCWPVRSFRPLDQETEVWTNGLAYASGGSALYPDAACRAWDY